MQDLLQALLHLNYMGHNIGGSDYSNICLYRDTYAEAAYFTYNQRNNKCYCKQDHNLDETRQEKTGRVSGNLNCEGKHDYKIQAIGA